MNLGKGVSQDEDSRYQKRSGESNQDVLLHPVCFFFGKVITEFEMMGVFGLILP
ncbi:MAG: hypothetical protein V1701_03690 [Planctomycetota bacterium]